MHRFTRTVRDIKSTCVLVVACPILPPRVFYDPRVMTVLIPLPPSGRYTVKYKYRVYGKTFDKTDTNRRASGSPLNHLPPEGLASNDTFHSSYMPSYRRYLTVGGSLTSRDRFHCRRRRRRGQAVSCANAAK